MKTCLVYLRHRKTGRLATVTLWAYDGPKNPKLMAVWEKNHIYNEAKLSPDEWEIEEVV